MTKSNLMIISKHYAQLHTVTLTPVKFQRNWSLTVGGDSHARQIVSILFGIKHD